MTTFTCPDCDETVPLGDTFTIIHQGRNDDVRRCGDCRSCSWCGETYTHANPCYATARVLDPERNPDGSVCVQCYASAKGLLAVMRPDGSILFSLGDAGMCAHIDCRRPTTVMLVPCLRDGKEMPLPFCGAHISWAQKRTAGGYEV